MLVIIFWGIGFEFWLVWDSGVGELGVNEDVVILVFGGVFVGVCG